METGLPDLQNFTLTVLKSYFEKPFPKKHTS